MTSVATRILDLVYQCVAELPEEGGKSLELGVVPVLKQPVEPLPTCFHDPIEGPPPSGRQMDSGCAPVVRVCFATDEPVALELLDLSGDRRRVDSEEVGESRHPERPVDMELVEQGGPRPVEANPGCLEKAFVESHLGNRPGDHLQGHLYPVHRSVFPVRAVLSTRQCGCFRHTSIIRH
jgi:hypothetical protein